MAIGIISKRDEEQWQVPLIRGTHPAKSEDISDNEYIVEHLRHLANKIEREQPKIRSISLIVHLGLETTELNLDVIP